MSAQTSGKPTVCAGGRARRRAVLQNSWKGTRVWLARGVCLAPSPKAQAGLPVLQHSSLLMQVQPVTTWAEMVAWIYDSTENWTQSSEIPDSALARLWFDWLKLHHSLSTGQRSHFVQGDKATVLWTKNVGKEWLLVERLLWKFSKHQECLYSST